MKENGKNGTAPKPSRPHIPGYGIDEKDLSSVLPWRWAERRLQKTQNYFLATVRSDGRPHVMPVWGVWVDNCFYFSTGRKSVKRRNLKNNPNCVVCAGEAKATVLVEGRASQVRSNPVLKKFAKAYIAKYAIDPLSMKEPIFTLKPRVAFGQIEKTFVKTATRWLF